MTTQQPQADTGSIPAASSSAAPALTYPLVMCPAALAYDWKVTTGIAQVNLYPITGQDMPLELAEPLQAFGHTAALQVPPTEGLLVNATLIKRSANHSYWMLRVDHTDGPVEGVESDLVRIPDWSQLDFEDLVTELAKAELLHGPDGQSALQAYLCAHWEYLQEGGSLLLPPAVEQALGADSKGLRGTRPLSWRALRDTRRTRG